MVCPGCSWFAVSLRLTKNGHEIPISEMRDLWTCVANRKLGLYSTRNQLRVGKKVLVDRFFADQEDYTASLMVGLTWQEICESEMALFRVHAEVCLKRP